MDSVLRLRKDLSRAQQPAVWAAPTRQMSLAQTDPEVLHAILTEAYSAGMGEIAPFGTWWPQLNGDSEFDPELVFIAADDGGQPIGIAQCWTSGFIKDLAVVPAWRGRGIGETLLQQTFWSFWQRGVYSCDLKVMAENTHAIALYRRMGMTVVQN
jgi:ribosomal protein S18 acetylase RimI-like enzyme